MFLLLAALSSCSAPVGTGRVLEADGVLIDETGRQLLLRGVNARVDGLFDVSFDDGRVALETIPAFGADDCRFLAHELGMNLLRLPVSWSALEPERDLFDMAYVDAIFSLVDDCHDYGVYTIVDLHQDAYSKEIGEDGAPLWAIVPEPEELLEGPLEDLEERRTSEQVLAAFASLYADAEGLHQEFADAAATLAERFVAHPGAVGLELHNEPVPLGDRAGLDALHDAMTQAVRAVDGELMVLFEPDSLRNLVDFVVVDSAFPHDNAVYSPHLYTGIFQGSPGSAGDIDASVTEMQAEAALHGAALFVGEFGADPKTEEGRRWLQDALDALDGARASWAWWVYEEYGQGQWGLYDSTEDERTDLRDEVVALMARPFPQRIHGRLETLSWDGDTLALRLGDAGRSEHVVGAPQALWSRATVTCDGRTVSHTLEDGRLRFSCAGERVEITGE